MRLEDGTYLSVLIEPTIRGARRDRILAAVRGGADPAELGDGLDDKVAGRASGSGDRVQGSRSDRERQ